MTTSSNPVALIHTIEDGDDTYKGIILWCPGCEYEADDGGKIGGLHMLPVSGDRSKRATWDWNSDLVNVTLSPSILTNMTRHESNFVCHSFLTDGMWQFLGDCTHKLANCVVPMSPLPDWIVR